MQIQLVQNCDCSADTVVRYVKHDTAPSFTCPILQSAYESSFGGDDVSLEAGEIKTLRLKVNRNFVNLVIVGFDCSKPTAFDDFRKVTAKLGNVLNGLKSKTVLVDKLLNLIFAEKAEIIRQFTSVLPLCEYCFDKYLSKKSEITEKTVYILADEEYSAPAKEGATLAQSVAIARDLVNEPPETLTPPELANRAVALAMNLDLKPKFLTKKPAKIWAWVCFWPSAAQALTSQS